VLLGPVSFLLLGKPADPSVHPVTLLDPLLEVYVDVLGRLRTAGAEWVQIDEPCLALDLPPGAAEALAAALARLAAAAPGLRLFLATYFGGLGENLNPALRLPIAALYLDLTRAPDQLEPALAAVPRDMSLSLGVIDGRNVWRADLDRALALVERAAEVLGPRRVIVAPSCSLLHVPIDLDFESDLDPEIRPWLAFAKQKIAEVLRIGNSITPRDVLSSLGTLERREWPCGVAGAAAEVGRLPGRPLIRRRAPPSRPRVAAARV
jgi:5-methyltetrahydropteroyltriglutamate--homocysteine methyltransferase